MVRQGAVARWEIGAAGIACLLVALAQFASAEISGGFWWFDSASHALNGVFLHDLLTSEGWRDPLAYSLNYFVHYPGLTLGFYPPGFAILLLPFYILVGVNHAAAQLCVSTASAALALGVFLLAREARLRTAPALGAALLAISFPEMLLWERQIQPEIPAYAFAVWSTWLLLRWVGSNSRPRQLYLAVLLFVLGLYVKQTICFLAPVFLLVLCCELKGSALRRREVWIAAAIGLATALPLVGLTLIAGGFNLLQATAAPSDGAGSGAGFYLAALPGQLGWLPLALALLGFIGLATGRFELSRPARILLLAWPVVGLAFFSAVALKSPRFSTAILPALAVAAVLPFTAVRHFRRPGEVIAIATCAGIAGFGLATTPSLSFVGSRTAAELVATAAPAGSNVLLLAHRSANFVFAMRCWTGRRDIRIVRAERLYTDYRVSKTFGISTNADENEQSMLEGMRTRNIALVVVERGFWDEVPGIHRLHRLVAGPPFDLVESVPLADSANPSRAGFLDIYRRRDYQHEPEKDLVVNLPLIGRRYTVPAQAM